MANSQCKQIDLTDKAMKSEIPEQLAFFLKEQIHAVRQLDLGRY